jgi:three-Cys-motif partner protein
MPPPADKPMRFSSAKRPIWTENKAKLIERYLYYFVLITKHGAYIDGFAAPQYHDKSDAWAAKLVLESKPARLREFWLCEIDDDGVAQLRQLVESQPKIRGRKIQVVPGDFNRNVATLLANSGIRDKTATFCLLDQRTFECEWETLIALSRHRSEYKIELFYFLATGWLDKSIKATKNTDVLQRWWGRNDYNHLLGMNSFDRTRLFCDRFKDELGYKHAFAWPIFSKEIGGRVMYHMIHATDHDEAPRIMHRAYQNALNEREELRRLQIDLGELWGNTGRGEKPIRR